MAATMARYLDQLGSRRGRRRSGLRRCAADVRRAHHRRRSGRADRSRRSSIVTSRRYKSLDGAAGPARNGRATLSATTISHRLGLLRTFFERIIDWDYDDAPRRSPIYAGDFPERDEPLPKFLDDPTAAKFMAALATDPNPRRRLMVELLARTGMRSGELAGARRRRHGPHRRHLLAAHPRRQAPQRPLRAAAPAARRVDQRLARHPSRPSRSGSARRTRRRPALRPAHHPPLRRRRRETSRRRPRPSPPAAPHARHPSHQPRA